VEKLIDARQAAELLGLSRQQIYLMSEKGQIPSYKIGFSRRFAIEDIKAWLEERRQGKVPA
jgi:excisionase family DNA binding protein